MKHVKSHTKNKPIAFNAVFRIYFILIFYLFQLSHLNRLLSQCGRCANIDNFVLRMKNTVRIRMRYIRTLRVDQIVVKQFFRSKVSSSETQQY